MRHRHPTPCPQLRGSCSGIRIRCSSLTSWRCGWVRPWSFRTKIPSCTMFSLFDGKRFDLGFYEAGSSRAVRFDRAGVSFLFCKVLEHSFGNGRGRRGLAHTLLRRVGPEGSGDPPTSSQRALPYGSLVRTQRRERVIKFGTRRNHHRREPIIGTIRVAENPSFTLTHKNKYGQDYVPPASGITY